MESPGTPVDLVERSLLGESEDEEKQAVSGAVSWGCVVAQDEGRLEEG